MKKLMLGLFVLGVCLLTTSAFGEVIDEDTVLMLHFNEEYDLPDFEDWSPSEHSITAYDDAQIDTAEEKFGGASVLFDGEGDYLTIPDSDDWNFGTGDFTVDFWVRFSSIISGNISFCSQATDWVNNQYVILYWYQPAGTLRFIIDGVPILEPPWTPATNTWYHIAIVRSGTTFTLYIDGTALASTIRSDSIGNYTGSLYIAATDAGGVACEFLNGWLDEFRISKGIARWTSDFIPPTAEYELPYSIPPVANAGADVVASSSEEVILDGSGSYDSDGYIVSWVWRNLSQLGNPVVAEGEVATINAGGGVEEIIELTIRDQFRYTSTDTMKIVNLTINDLQDADDDLQAQIDGLGTTQSEIIGDLGIMQSQITDQQTQISEQQQVIDDMQEDINRILSNPMFRFGIKPSSQYPYIYPAENNKEVK